MLLREFNKMPKAEALDHMIGCCHSHRWALAMLRARPFIDFPHMLDSAQDIWAQMEESDYLEAFKGHARIGDMQKLRDKFSRAHAEQGQLAQASEKVIQVLFELNQYYEARHGFIFIVCATGKSAGEMLTLLQGRLPQSRAVELRNAAAEQSKITAIRLRALFVEEAEEAH
ncbi:MAG: 2-oxo-4-hydroxy-4-carboxy-5-ureidoimidazoline decarboxylase [Pseudomonadota bacterium]